jgi:anti-anti-sigma factor
MTFRFLIQAGPAGTRWSPTVADLAIVYRRQLDHMVVQLSGELDICRASELRRELASLIDARGVRALVIDLSNLEFIDAAGLGVFVHAHQRIRARDGTIRLIHPRPNVRRALDIAGLSHTFEVHQSDSLCRSSIGAR